METFPNTSLTLEDVTESLALPVCAARGKKPRHWSLRETHTQRPVLTLTTLWAQIGNRTLNIGMKVSKGLGRIYIWDHRGRRWCTPRTKHPGNNRNIYLCSLIQQRMNRFVLEETQQPLHLLCTSQKRPVLWTRLRSKLISIIWVTSLKIVNHKSQEGAVVQTRRESSTIWINRWSGLGHNLSPTTMQFFGPLWNPAGATTQVIIGMSASLLPHRVSMLFLLLRLTLTDETF